MALLRTSRHSWRHWLAILAILLQPLASIAPRGADPVAERMLHAFCSAGGTAGAVRTSDGTAPLPPGDAGRDCPCCAAGGCVPGAIVAAIALRLAPAAAVAIALPHGSDPAGPQFSWLSLHERGPPAA